MAMGSTKHVGVNAQFSAIRVEVIRAERSHFGAVPLVLAEGATVEAAAAESGLLQAARFGTEVLGYAVHGERVEPTRRLRDGDRVELLSGLIADPKQARRRRAAEAVADRKR